jgi:ribosomal protein S27E
MDIVIDYLSDIKGYNSLQEKDAIIQVMNNESPTEIAKTLGLNPDNDLEAIAMIFQSRKKSVSEIIEVQIKCPSCNTNDFYFINIDDLFFKNIDKLDLSIPIKLINDIEDIEKLGISDDMSIEEFNQLEEKIVENNKIIFNNNLTVHCKACGNPILTSINYQDIISKFPIKNIYEQYVDITQFTNMNKSDVDNMPPFEREIFIGIIQDKENKKNQGQG